MQFAVTPETSEIFLEISKSHTIRLVNLRFRNTHCCAY